MMKKEKR